MSASSDFAVFINSKSAIVKSTQKSVVSIPFVANLSKHDPNKYISLSVNQFMFTNSMYNIVEGYDRLQVCITYEYNLAPGGTNRVPRNNDLVNDPEEFNLYELIDIKVPHMNYNFVQFADFLTETLGYEIVQQLFIYPTSYTYNDIFVGFGARPLNTEDPVVTPAAAADLKSSKIILSSPDLNHMTQFGCDKFTPFQMPARDINGPTVQPGKLPKYSYLISGIYLVANAETTPLMKLLGFVTIDSIPKPIIPGSIDASGSYLVGYGTPIYSKQINVGGAPSDNTVIFGVPDPLNPFNPDAAIYNIDASSSFVGLIVEIGNSLTVPTLASSITNDAIPYLDPGQFISGALISIPNPYIISIQQAYFTALYTAATPTILTNVTPNALSLITNGMAICNGTEGLAVPDPISSYGNYAVGYNAGTAELTLASDFTNFGPGGAGFAEYRRNGTNIIEVPVDGETYDIYGFVYHLSSTQEIIPSETMTATVSGKNPSSLVIPYSASNFSGLDEIYLRCDQLHTKFMSSDNALPLAPSNTIAVIPVDSAYGTKGTWQPPFPLQCALNNTNITQLDFTLTNSKNELLDFNGVDWSMTVFCSQVRASPLQLLVLFHKTLIFVGR
jgi:hypothetical protein